MIGRLSKFEATSSGHFTASPTTGAAAIKGSSAADADKLEALDPGLRILGSLRFQGRLDLAVDAGKICVSNLDLSATEDKPVLASPQECANYLRPAQPSINGRDDITNETEQLQEISLVWTRPFVHVVGVFGSQLTDDFSIPGEGKTVTARHHRAVTNQFADICPGCSFADSAYPSSVQFRSPNYAIPPLGPSPPVFLGNTGNRFHQGNDDHRNGSY